MRDRVLVVEEEEDSTNRAIRRFFEFQGFHVDCASEPEEAEALLSNYAYGIVISSLRLTAAYGSEGLRVLSYAQDHCPSARAVMLAAPGHSEIEDEARGRGIAILERSQILGLPRLAS